MIVYIKQEYIDAFRKVGRDKKFHILINEMIENGVYGVEAYNEYVFKHPYDLSVLEFIDLNKSIGKVKSINWELGYIDISFKKEYTRLKKCTLKAIPVIFTHYYSGASSDSRLRLNKIFIEALEE